MKRTATYVIALALLLSVAPTVVFADGGHLPPYWGPIVSCTDGDVSCNFCELIHTGVHVTSFAATAILFAIVPFMFVVGALMLIVAGGSENMISRGRKTLMGAAIGGVGALVAYAIVSTILWLLGNDTGGISVSWPDIQCGL